MPKENKHSRGKRGEKAKRKRDDAEDGDEITKRHKPDQMEDVQFTETGSTQAESIDPPVAVETESLERPFYGLLEDDEQEYFRRADELLEVNDFESEEQRQLFLTSLFREAEGKELKIANSQSCSRLMERLILLSSPIQKKRLFEKFSGNFLHLIQHRFASHCCETLFIQSAPVVTAELIGDDVEQLVTDGESSTDVSKESMENLFLYTLNELEGHMAFLLTDRFASHALRVLLVVLSGKPLENATKSLLQSKKKEKITVHGNKLDAGDIGASKRVVPESFQFAVEKIISDTVASMDSSFVRVLATHPMGNPTLQLLLELELTQQGKKKGNEEGSVIRKLLPDDLSDAESESVAFVNGLLYDHVGSRLLETIVTHAPGKLFKQLYKTCFKDRMGSLARNETAGFVVQRVLERLNADDLRDAVASILPQIPGLVERSRTSVIKTIIERCVVRRADMQELADTLKTCYGEDPQGIIPKMVILSAALQEGGPKAEAKERNVNQLHGSLLAQTMLHVPGPLAELIQDSLLAQPSEILLRMSEEICTSHIIQAAVKPSRSNIPFRRKLANKLLPLAPALAIHTCGFHVVDALWMGTEGIMNLKERIAASLLEHETELRDSYEGRKIWRTWMLDLFKRKKFEWVKKAKSGNGGVPWLKEKDFPTAWEDDGPGVGNADKQKLGKTQIELARERFWEEKEKSERKKVSAKILTGANRD